MFKSVFSKSLYERRLSTLFWSLGLFLITLFTMSFFPYFKEGNFDQLLKSLPKGLQSIAGSLGSTQTVSGYAGQQIYALRAPMFLLIMAIGVFIALSAGDEERGTMHTLLSLPISRSRVYVEKLLAGTTMLLVASICVTLGIVASVVFIHQSVPPHVLLDTFIGCFVITMSFGVFAFALGMITGRRGFSMGVASAVAIASYLVNSLAPAVDKLKSADKLTIFHYYNSADIALKGLNFTNLILQIVIMIVLIAISWRIFMRRDLKNEA